MSNGIHPKAYEQDCGCGAPAGTPCPHTPIRCQHSWRYDNPQHDATTVGASRECIYCRYRVNSRIVWDNHPLPFASSAGSLHE